MLIASILSHQIKPVRVKVQADKRLGTLDEECEVKCVLDFVTIVPLDLDTLVKLGEILLHAVIKQAKFIEGNILGLFFR